MKFDGIFLWIRNIWDWLFPQKEQEQQQERERDAEQRPLLANDNDDKSLQWIQRGLESGELCRSTNHSSRRVLSPIELQAREVQYAIQLLSEKRKSLINEIVQGENEGKVDNTNHVLHIPYFALHHCSFASRDLHQQFLRALAQHYELRSLVLDVLHLPLHFVVQDIANAFVQRHLETLTLHVLSLNIMHNNDDSNDKLAWTEEIQKLLQVPTQTLKIQGDWENFTSILPCLAQSAQRQQEGYDNKEYKSFVSLLPSAVHLRIDRIRGYPLYSDTTNFVQFCKTLPQTTNIITSLELSVFLDQDHLHVILQTMTALLTAQPSRLHNLKVHMAMTGLDGSHPSNTTRQQQLRGPSTAALTSRLREALETNTTLQTLALECTPKTGLLTKVWTAAIIPALTVNRTLKVLQMHPERNGQEFFLDHLSQIQGLTDIKLAWHPSLGQDWVDALEKSETLQRVEFYNAWRRSRAQEEQIQTIQRYCRRNCLIHEARSFRKRLPRPSADDILRKLVTLGGDEVGLSAVFIVCRAFVDLFVLSSRNMNRDTESLAKTGF